MTAQREEVVPAQAPARRRWCLGTRLLVGAAIVWVAFDLCQRLLSGRWWVWELPDVLPPLLFLLVPLLFLLSLPALAAVRVRLPVSARKWVAGAAIVALPLGFDQAGLNLAAITGGPDGPAPPDAVHVFSWNTEYWDQTDDPDRFYAFLKAQHADVYLLQEYLNWDDGRGDEAAVRVVDTPRLAREFPGYTLIWRGELLTLSRFPVLAHPPVGPDRRIAGRPGVDWQTEFRIAKVLRTDLLVNGRALSVYNVHIPVQLSGEPFNAGFYRYLAGAAAQRRDQFLGLESDVAANPNPTLVAGDFNTSPAMGELTTLRDTMSDAARASHDFYPTSWNAKGLPLWRLDWTFTTRGVQVHRYAFTDAESMSDHRPQDLTISLPRVVIDQ